MEITLDRQRAAVAGFGIGATVGYVGARRATSTPFAQGMASGIGAWAGSRLETLPVVPKWVAAYQGQRAARAVVDRTMPNLHPHVRSYLIDGVGSVAGMKASDPNAVLKEMRKLSRQLLNGGADGIGKKFPGIADEADAIAKTLNKGVRVGSKQGVIAANAALGAQGGRFALGKVPVLAAIVAGGIGAAVGAATLSGTVSVPDFSAPDLDLDIQRTDEGAER